MRLETEGWVRSPTVIFFMISSSSTRLSSFSDSGRRQQLEARDVEPRPLYGEAGKATLQIVDGSARGTAVHAVCIEDVVIM